MHAGSNSRFKDLGSDPMALPEGTSFDIGQFRFFGSSRSVVTRSSGGGGSAEIPGGGLGC